jgi:hypothetical protein
VLLASQNFAASDFIAKVELPTLTTAIKAADKSIYS